MKETLQPMFLDYVNLTFIYRDERGLDQLFIYEQIVKRNVAQQVITLTLFALIDCVTIIPPTLSISLL